MKTIRSILALLLVSSFFSCLHVDSRKLVWHDEFDYTGKPDSTRWGYDLGGSGWGNNEAQFYTNHIRNAHVENGMLTIEAINEKLEGKEYTSARLVTKNKGDWKYGRIEVRAKLPHGTGTWPAIWMLPTDWKYGGWPASGEIDIMEHVGFDPGKIHGTLHSEKYNHIKQTQQEGITIVADCQDAFHLYAIEWTENQIRFFVDDKKYFSVTRNPQDDYTGWPFDQRFHLILNIAVGGNWGGMKGIDPTIWPQQMLVDYVRVYQ
ncbi:MAG: glycoside hydrolase family 16 protein [Bacteroidetes bacterium]|nr:glycoside hydrolase family 16 protein [Bacteroidota bacterium]MBS1539245.1 glycoside hydrolase family 16 protein [Bacteroidota bacterium]